MVLIAPIGRLVVVVVVVGLGYHDFYFIFSIYIVGGIPLEFSSRSPILAVPT
jgi:hypothetical protein